VRVSGRRITFGLFEQAVLGDAKGLKTEEEEEDDGEGGAESGDDVDDSLYTETTMMVEERPNKRVRIGAPNTKRRLAPLSLSLCMSISDSLLVLVHCSLCSSAAVLHRSTAKQRANVGSSTESRRFEQQQRQQRQQQPQRVLDKKRATAPLTDSSSAVTDLRQLFCTNYS
jgi:hypothetical protein